VKNAKSYKLKIEKLEHHTEELHENLEEAEELAGFLIQSLFNFYFQAFL
jgi:hypothetical protein